MCKNYAEIFEDTIINDYQKILILEDDIYFLKDLDLLKTIVLILMYANFIGIVFLLGLIKMSINQILYIM